MEVRESIVGREMCIFERGERKVMVVRWFWCVKAVEGHGVKWRDGWRLRVLDDRTCCLC